jgi:hypothetical protein
LAWRISIARRRWKHYIWSYGWLNDQHMGASMQMFYINKLQSIRCEQHTYAIIRRFNRIINKAIQHIFINNNYWILLEIHTSTPCSHRTIHHSNNLS